MHFNLCWVIWWAQVIVYLFIHSFRIPFFLTSSFVFLLSMCSTMANDGDQCKREITKKKSVKTIKSRYLLDAFWTCYSVYQIFGIIRIWLGMLVCVSRCIDEHKPQFAYMSANLLWRHKKKEWQQQKEWEKWLNTLTHINSSNQQNMFSVCWPVWFLLFSSLYLM